MLTKYDYVRCTVTLDDECVKCGHHIIHLPGVKCLEPCPINPNREKECLPVHKKYAEVIYPFEKPEPEPVKERYSNDVYVKTKEPKDVY